MKNIKWYTTVLVMTFFITSVSLAQELTKPPKPPKAPKIVGYSNEDVQDEKELLDKMSPELKADLLKVKDIDKEEYEDLLRNVSYSSYDMYTGFMEPKEKERYENERIIDEMEVRSEALGIRYEHSSSESEKQKIASDLKTVLNQLFDMKERSRTLEVEHLEKELKQLKESLKVRKQSKNEIINRRLNELIGKGDYLDW
jgi:hypothetical protein